MRAKGLVLFPGAGSDRDHSSLRVIESRLAPMPVARIDCPYRRAGRRAPDRAPVLLDCVVNEAIGVIGRRAEEQQRSDQFGRLLDKLLSLVPNEAITWISVDSERLFPEILAVCRGHQGRLDFHDAFIALVCRELGIKAIVSFDRDFDSIPWLKRVDTPVGVSNLLAET